MQPDDIVYRERIEVKGLVQGVGFRPFVVALAHRFELKGFVRNHSSGVTIEIEGLRNQLASFTGCLQNELPSLARMDSADVQKMTPVGCKDFRIVESKSMASASTPISPDVATCHKCLAEFNDQTNRRYRYPFTNCTNCGPRYTIIRDMPYDRPQTTMSDFEMCKECAREYHDPADRRYHAQPNACPACGPTVWFLMGGKEVDLFAIHKATGAMGEQAIQAFHQLIHDEKIVATKGIGGFHLACSANSSIAIRKLRDRKQRIDKPLALMVANVEAARQFAVVDRDEERLLESRERPIVLVRRRPDCHLSEWIAPGTDSIGIMLPYSPLHVLIVERQPLVMTSGNLSEEPIARTNWEAYERLDSLADAFLLHDREIHAVCDDSVVRVLRGRNLPIRRSRGYAPIPLRLNDTVPSVLAVGGEFKSTFCMTKDNYAYMSPHIGDMGNFDTLESFHRTVDHFQKLFRVDPAVIACDLHPNYLSSQWARERARSAGLKLIEVQHHHAHVASVLAEHIIDSTNSVIGVSFDGTGFGPDDAIWGSEFLIASLVGYKRWAHLKYVPSLGGDVSVKHPFRSALSHLWSAGIPWDDRLPCVAQCPPKNRIVLLRQLEQNFHCVPTSSMGRLFDAVAALIGIRQSVNYEAQAAIEMEAMSTDVRNTVPYPFLISSDAPHGIDPSPLLRAIFDDVLSCVAPSVIAERFHASIAYLIHDVCVAARCEERLNQVALSGGVFQNKLLLEHTLELLEESKFEVLTHRMVPPNDGGLALGQAMVAAASIPFS